MVGVSRGTGGIACNVEAPLLESYARNGAPPGVISKTVGRNEDWLAATRTSVAPRTPYSASSVACTAVLWAIAPWIVSTLYGEDYVAAVPAFRILMLSFPLLSLKQRLPDFEPS